MHGGVRLALGLSLSLYGAPAWGQDAKDHCADASERGQKLVDDRKLLSARNAFLLCAQESCPGPVRRDCQAQLDALKQRGPSVIVRAKDKGGADIATGTVALDGVPVGSLDGHVLEVDPGAHQLHVELVDGRKLDQAVVLASGDQNRSVSFDFGGPRSALPPTVVVHETKTGWAPVRTAGFITIWVGAAGFTAGLLLQLLALAEHSNAISEQKSSSFCPSLSTLPSSPDTSCQNALNYESQANGDQTAALAVGIGGLVVLATGVVFFAAGGNKVPSVAVRPLISPTFAGLGLQGAF
jgi:hypothetical protein